MFGSEPKSWRGAQGQQTLFCRSDLNGVLRTREEQVLQDARGVAVTSWHQSDLKDLARMLVQRATIEIPVLQWNQVEWSEGEARINVEHRAEYFGFMGDGHVDGEWMKARVPATGDTQVLEWHGSTFTLNPPLGILEQNAVCMVIEDTQGKLTVEHARKQFEDWKNQVKDAVGILQSNYEGWAQNTEQKVLEVLKARAEAQAARQARTSELNKTLGGAVQVGQAVKQEKTAVTQSKQKGVESSRPGDSEGETEQVETEGQRRERPDIFLSFAGEQRANVARPLRKALKRMGIVVWMDEYDIRPGELWQNKIQEAMDDARYIVAVVSREWLDKDWPRREAQKAVRLGRDHQERVIPILVEVDPEDPDLQGDWMGAIQAIQWEGKPTSVAKKIAAVVRNKQ